MRKRIVSILTTVEIHNVLATLNPRYPTKLRNRALVAVLWRCGLRCQEALDLADGDLDTEVGSLRVRNGKGGKHRVVGIDKKTINMIRAWRSRRDKLLAAHGEVATAEKLDRLIFCTLDGKALATSYVRAFLRRAGAKAGLDKSVHPHAFRHTFASELAKEGRPLNLIQLVLGHSNLATTSRYLEHLCPREVLVTMTGRTW